MAFSPSLTYTPAIAVFTGACVFVITAIVFYSEKDCKKDSSAPFSHQMVSEWFCCKPEYNIGLIGGSLSGCCIIASAIPVVAVISTLFPGAPCCACYCCSCCPTVSRGCCTSLILLGIGLIGLLVFDYCDFYITHASFAVLGFVGGGAFAFIYNIAFLTTENASFSDSLLKSVLRVCMLIGIAMCSSIMVYQFKGLLLNEDDGEMTSDLTLVSEIGLIVFLALQLAIVQCDILEFRVLAPAMNSLLPSSRPPNYDGVGATTSSEDLNSGKEGKESELSEESKSQSMEFAGLPSQEAGVCPSIEAPSPETN